MTTKARALANLISSGNLFADGQVAASEVTGLHTVATSGSYSDLVNKPTVVSHFTNDANYASTTYVNTQMSSMVASAPATLDTLNELAAALGNDANFSTSTATALGNRLRVDTAAQALSALQKTNAKTNLDLQNVENKSSATIRGELTSSNVTTALGFTPYNSTNPSGYISGNQTITFSGDATGSGAVTVALTLANSGVTAGTYGSSTNIPQLVVDAKGRVTSVSNVAVSIPSGALSFTGDVTGTGSTGSSTALTLANSGVTAGTYTKVTVDAKGRVTTGATLASADLPTYTGSLTSAQVTGALGYTPYNSTNPSGYTSNTGTVTSVSGTGTVSGLTLSGTVTGSGSLTLGGTITGFIPTTGGTSSGLITAPNFGDASGSYNVNLGSGGSEGRGVVAGYSGGWYGGIGYNVRHTSSSGVHIAPLADTSSYLLFNGGGFNFYGAGSGAAGRTLSFSTLATLNASGVFNTLGAITQAGNQVLHAGNYTSYSPSLTGNGASGTWGINITGNAATATSADQIDGWGFRNTGSNSGTDANSIDSNGITYYTAGVTNFSGNATDGALYSQRYSTDWQHQIAGDYRSGQIALRGKNAGTWQSWRTVLDSSNYTNYSPSLTGSGASGTWGINITGNAATASQVGGYTSDGWLRKVGDSTQFQMYGNSRSMIYRTDGVTNPHGGGSYAHIFYYGGSGDNQRVFIVNTDGRLYSPYHGWLDTMSTTGNAGTVGNLSVHTGRNNEANKIVRTDSNGYIQAGWINTDSGDSGVANRLTRIYSSYDGYLRFSTLTDFKVHIGESAKNNYSRRIDYTSDSNYWVGSMGHSGYGANETFHGGSGFFDIWSGTNYPSGTSHIHGFNALHYTTNSLGSTGGNAYGIQVAGQYDRGGEIWSRGCSGGSFSSWRRQLDDTNYSSYALPLSGGTVTGGTTFSNTVNFNSIVNVNGRDIRPFENDSYKEFYVGGDANTYYPVRFDVYAWFHFARWSISRGYGDTAPWDPIGTGAHRGGLTLTWEWSGDGAWGGNDKTIRVIQFSEQYTTMVGGLALSVNGLIVWLRGGNAYYRFHGPGGTLNGATPYYSTYTASNGATYSPRSYDANTVASEVTARMPVRGLSELYDGNNRVLHLGNYSSYAVPLSGGTMTGRLTTTAWTTSGRNYSNEWIEFSNYSGLYSPLNGAHFYPNNASYGGWRVAGSRNGWHGLEFDAGNGNVTLMINPDSNTSGFHNNAYGWQWRWNAGTIYCHKNNYGGGTAAVVLDSVNASSYAVTSVNGQVGAVTVAAGGEPLFSAFE